MFVAVVMGLYCRVIDHIDWKMHQSFCLLTGLLSKNRQSQKLVVCVRVCVRVCVCSKHSVII